MYLPKRIPTGTGREPGRARKSRGTPGGFGVFPAGNPPNSFGGGRQEGKLVRVAGQVVEGPNIYMRGPILRVIRIEPLPVPKDPVVKPVGR